MHVLVASSKTQGSRPDDFCWAVEGELVRRPVLECDSGDACGCARGFAGLSSHRATTTAIVVDRPDLDAPTYRELMLDDARVRGYRVDHRTIEFLDEDIGFLVFTAAAWPVGTVVGRSGDEIYRRDG